MRSLTIGCAAFVLLLGGSARLEAQAIASSFDQLAFVLEAGDKISVVDIAGKESEGRVGIGGVIFAGLGAAAGAGIDAMIARQQVIYERSASGGWVTVSPIWGPERRGVAISVRF